MTQLIRAVRYGDSLTIITHVFSVPSDTTRPVHQKTLAQFPQFILSENETKDEFSESFKDSVQAHPARDELDLYLIQRGSSLYFGLKQIQAEFIAAVKETFGWTQDVEIKYPISEQFCYERKVVAYKYPLKTPEEIVANILAGELFPTKVSLDLYNEHVTKMRSLR